MPLAPSIQVQNTEHHEAQLRLQQDLDPRRQAVVDDRRPSLRAPCVLPHARVAVPAAAAAISRPLVRRTHGLHALTFSGKIKTRKWKNEELLGMQNLLTGS